MTALDCPRCGQSSEERFYGPCSPCREELGKVKAPKADPCYKRTERMNGERAVAPPSGGCEHDEMRRLKRDEWAAKSRIHLKGLDN